MSRSSAETGLSLEALADAADRANRLQRVTDRLAEALTPQQVLDAILTEGLRAAEARAGAIGIVSEDGEWIELLAQRGYKRPILTEWGRFPVSAELPMSHVVRNGEPLFLESLKARNEHEDGDDGGERELEPRIEERVRVPCEQHDRADEEQVPAIRRTGGQPRDGAQRACGVVDHRE